MTEGACDCAERTGELVVFTCPKCLGPVAMALRALCDQGVLVRLDKSGSVSGLVEVEDSHG